MHTCDLSIQEAKAGDYFKFEDNLAYIVSPCHSELCNETLSLKKPNKTKTNIFCLVLWLILSPIFSFCNAFTFQLHCEFYSVNNPHRYIHVLLWIFYNNAKCSCLHHNVPKAPSLKAWTPGWSYWETMSMERCALWVSASLRVRLSKVTVSLELLSRWLLLAMAMWYAAFLPTHIFRFLPGPEQWGQYIVNYNAPNWAKTNLSLKYVISCICPSNGNWLER